MKIDFRIPVSNRLALRLKKVNLLEDKRKRNWILLDNKENEIDIRKVVRKKKKKSTSREMVY